MSDTETMTSSQRAEATMSDIETMTSSKRIEANRRNATRSTGPKSPESKSRTRFNALKHGMRAATPVLPGEDPVAFQDRLDRWTADLAPRDDVEQFLVRRAVQLSWQLERADRALAAGPPPDPDAPARRAEEVVALGRRLFWDPRGPLGFYPQYRPEFGPIPRLSWSGQADDPDDPARLVIRLEATAIGCAWMLDRWGELRDILESGRTWQPPDRLKATRLLGRQPIDALEDDRVRRLYFACAAMGPPGRSAMQDMATEVAASEAERLMERVMERVDAASYPRDAAMGQAALLEIIGAEEERLEGLLAGHLEREETAAGDPGFDGGEAGERVRRYMASCDRTLLRILEAMRKRHREADGTKSEGRGKAGPKREESSARSRGFGVLLDMIAEVKAAGAAATNKANAPTIEANAPTIEANAPAATAGRAASGESAGPSRPEEAPAPPASGPAVVDVPAAATNEANDPRRPTPPTSWAGPVAVLALLILLGGAAVVAAVSTAMAAIAPARSQVVMVGKVMRAPDQGLVGRQSSLELLESRLHAERTG